ncbi:MAG: C4-type zinc ribbon domain-containing protein [Thermodesulfobacteriota bacterium]
MESLIEILASLQEIDRRNRERQLELAELERQSTELQERLTGKRQRVEAARVESGNANGRRRQLEEQLQDEERKIKERRMRLNRIRNDKELVVAQREIELTKEANSRLEEEILTLLEQSEAVDGGLREAEGELRELEERVAKHEEHARSRIAQLRGEIESDRGERDALASKLNVSVRKRYEQVFARRGGVAVVEVRRGICLGCNMHVPPQLYIEIQKGRDVIVCPSCQRILYSRGESAADEQQARSGS